MTETLKDLIETNLGKVIDPKLKDTDFTSFIVVQCTTLFICISNIKTLIYATHCSTVQCNISRK